MLHKRNLGACLLILFCTYPLHTITASYLSVVDLLGSRALLEVTFQANPFQPFFTFTGVTEATAVPNLKEETEHLYVMFRLTTIKNINKSVTFQTTVQVAINSPVVFHFAISRDNKCTVKITVHQSSTN